MHSDLDEARKALLLNLIETYLQLSGTEEEEFRRMIGQGEMKEVREMLTVYEIRGMRKALLRQMRLKFGDLPEKVLEKIQAIEDEAELDRLAERILIADSLDEMGLEER